MLRSRISSHVVDLSQASRSSCFDMNITGARKPNGSKTLAAERNKSLVVVLIVGTFTWSSNASL